MAGTRDDYELRIQTQQAERALNGIKNALGAVAGAFAIRELIQYGSAILATTIQFEKYRATLQTFLGSQQAANQAMARLEELATTLPQDIDDITNAFVILARTGLKGTNQEMQNVANIAAGSSRSISQFAEAVADALTGEFERLKEFGIKVGKEGGQLIARIGEETVAVADNATELTKQLVALGATKFKGAADNLMNTLGGVMSQLSDSVTKTQKAIGEGMTPALMEVIKQLTEFIIKNKDAAKSLGEDLGKALLMARDAALFLAENIDIITVAIAALAAGKLVVLIKSMSVAIGLLGVAIAAIAAPVVIAVASVAALTAAWLFLGDNVTKVGNTTTSYGEIVKAVLSRSIADSGRFTEEIGVALPNAWNSLTKKVDEFNQFFYKIFNNIADVVKGPINQIIGYHVAFFKQVTVGLTDIPKIFLAAFEASGNIVGMALDNIGGQFGEFFDFITSFGEDKIEDTFKGFGGIILSELDKIGNASTVDWDEILGRDYLGDAADAVTQTITGIGDSLSNSLSKSLEDAVIAYRKKTAEVKPFNPELESADRQMALLEQQKKLMEDIAAIRRQELGVQKDQLISLNSSTDAFIAQYREKTRLLGLSEDERDIQETIAQARLGLETMLAPLITRRGELEKDNNDTAKAQLVILNQTIAALQEQFNIAIPGIRGMVEARQAELDIQEQLIATDELRTSLAQQIAAIQGRSKTAKEDAQLDGLRGIRRELKAIELQENRSADAAKARLKEQFSGADPTALRNALKEINAATNESIRVQQTLAQQSYENARAFSIGWKTAFDEYKDNASDAAKTAQKLFETSTQGIEDAIVGFVKTGKFEFRDLIDTILEQLLRSQIQQLIANTFGGIFGGSGGGSAATPPINGFAGMFGNGGTIPAGQFGIVGERGPETVKGPVTVTPGASGTNVTYNINAVDANSFKQMIARDPEFLYAVTERGKRSMPQTRR